MKKTFATMFLLGSTVAAFAQGTVYFSNNAFERIWSAVSSGIDSHTIVPATAGLLNFGLFYGTGATQPATLTFLGSVSGVNSATSAGLIVNTSGNPITALGIPGTFPGETDGLGPDRGLECLFRHRLVCGASGSGEYPR